MAEGFSREKGRRDANDTQEGLGQRVFKAERQEKCKWHCDAIHPSQDATCITPECLDSLSGSH